MEVKKELTPESFIDTESFEQMNKRINFWWK